MEMKGDNGDLELVRRSRSGPNLHHFPLVGISCDQREDLVEPLAVEHHGLTQGGFRPCSAVRRRGGLAPLVPGCHVGAARQGWHKIRQARHKLA